MPSLPGSLALDAAVDCTDVACAPVLTDQRGVTRPQEGKGSPTVTLAPMSAGRSLPPPPVQHPRR